MPRAANGRLGKKGQKGAAGDTRRRCCAKRRLLVPKEDGAQSCKLAPQEEGPKEGCYCHKKKVLCQKKAAGARAALGTRWQKQAKGRNSRPEQKMLLWALA